jgi:hypothetical protein
MNYEHYKELQKEFKTGMLAGVTLVLGVIAIAVMIYAMFNPSIVQ